MALSSITLAVEEGHVASLATFLHNSNVYLVWATANTSERDRSLFWRVRNAPTGTLPVLASQVAPYGNLAVHLRADGKLLVVFDDAVVANPDTTRLYSAVFDVQTGALISTMTSLGNAGKPGLVTSGGRLALFFHVAESFDQIRVATSDDDGTTWSPSQPVLNNRSVKTSAIVPLVQSDGRAVLARIAQPVCTHVELGSFTRTRPMTSAALLYTRVLIATEASQGTVPLNDNLRGRVAVDGNEVFAVGRVRLGTNDGVGEISRLNMSNEAAFVINSTNVTGAAVQSVNVLTGALVPVTQVDLSILGVLGNAVLVDLALTLTRVYVAAYSDAALEGGLVAINRSAYTAQAVLTDRVFAVATTGAYVVSAGESVGGYELRVWMEATPGPLTLIVTGEIDARVNALTAVSPSVGQLRVYASMADRLVIYDVDTNAGVIRAESQVQLWTHGGARRVVLLPSGNLAVVTGTGGVLFISARGETLALAQLAGVVPPEWQKATTYAPGALVRPTEVSFYSPERKYFVTAGGGMSADAEPPWAPSGAVSDGGVTWVQAGSMDAYITDLVLDVSAQRLYAVGVVGGARTEGRVYSLSADGMLMP